MLPPDSARAGASGPAPRTSKSSTMRRAWACAARRRTHLMPPMRREKCADCRRSLTAFSHSARSPIRPTSRRSSGIRARPCSTRRAGSADSAAPRNCTRPALAARVPLSSSARATWPLPETPAMATTSPPRSSSDTPSRRSRPSAVVLTRSSTHSAWPTAPAGWRPGSSIARPTIHSASCSCVTAPAAACATSLPARSTAMRCDTRSTSASLWLMKMIDSPCATIWAKVSNKPSLSCGVSTAVGSSRIRMRAPRTRAFKISTRWRSPTVRPATRASGCTARPKRCAVRSRCARAARRRDHGRHSGSVPSITLSSTLRLSASVKCWCTMPMPAASAALGWPGCKGWPNTSMQPASAS